MSDDLTLKELCTLEELLTRFPLWKGVDTTLVLVRAEIGKKYIAYLRDHPLAASPEELAKEELDALLRT